MSQDQNFLFQVKISSFVKIIAILSVAVFLASLITQIIHYLPPGSFPLAGSRFRILNLDEENNIPTWYSSMILFASAILFGLITIWKNHTKDKFRYYWLALTLGFLVMSMDEVASIHERLVQPIDTTLKITYTNHFSWLLAGIPLVAILGILFLRFWMQLESSYKWLFLAAGGLYLSGVIGLELVDGIMLSKISEPNMGYAILTNFEEFLEIAGVTVLIYTLLHYIRDKIPGTVLNFEK